ncbi:MAG: hypothetical protein R2722_02005 [Tessaracoccus sp.]
MRVATTGRGRAIITVSDMGDGMTQRQRESLFDPFVVGESSRAGTGLGMMITSASSLSTTATLARRYRPGPRHHHLVDHSDESKASRNTIRAPRAHRRR